jgi:hypothetical protein
VQKSTRLSEEDWKNMWAARITDFFGSNKGRSKGRAASGVREPERAATQQWLREMSKSLSTVGWGWHSCSPLEDGRQRVLILCTDQEGTQLAAANYLKFGQSLFVEHVSDPAHRSHNDVHLSLASSGLLSFAMWCVGLYNIRYGPWNKGAWFGKVRETADRMSSSMSPSDPLLVAFFPDILVDQGRSDTENTEDARRSFLAALPNMGFVRSKGTKASPSRFNSLSLAHAELDGEWSAFALVLVVLAIGEGWSSAASDLWSPESAAAGDAAPSARAAAKAAARKAMDKERGRSVNTLHVMTKFACNPDNRFLARLVFFVTQPEALRCSRMLQVLRSQKATIESFAGWAHWDWMATAQEHVARLSDLPGLQRLGLDFSLEFTSKDLDAALASQDAIARKLVLVTHRLLRFRAGSQLSSTNGWGATAGLLHPEETRRSASLSFLQEVHMTLEKTEQNGSLEAKRLLEGHPGKAPLMAKVLKELEATSFLAVPEGTEALLRSCWGGLLNSKLVEDGNKIQREAEQRHSTSKTLGRVDGWYSLSRKRLLESYERKEVPCGALCHLPESFDAETWFTSKKRRLSKDGSSALESNMSVAEKQEASIVEGVTKARTWASRTPESEQDVLASFSLLARIVRDKADWGKAELAWHASLLPESHAVLLPGSDKPVYIVRSYKHAALAWPGTLEKVGEMERLVLTSELSSLYWVHVFNTDAVVLELEAAAPQSYSEEVS